MIYYKVWPINNVHIWDAVSFREETNSIEFDFSNTGFIIHYIIYGSETEIDPSLFQKYGFNYCILENYTPKSPVDFKLTTRDSFSSSDEKKDIVETAKYRYKNYPKSKLWWIDKDDDDSNI